MNEHAFENGFCKISEEDSSVFYIEFDLTETDSKIRIASRSFLDGNIAKLYTPDEHIIYILVKDNVPVYVGQTKDSLARINNHRLSDKAGFDRCFMFFKPRKDLRAYLDYMESYVIHKIEKKGIVLKNIIKKDPEKDILTRNKKIIAQKWMNNFVDFLTIFGVSMKPIPSISESIIDSSVEAKFKKNIIMSDDGKNKKADSVLINIRVDGVNIDGNNNKEKVINLIKEIGIKNINSKVSLINTNSIIIKDKIFEHHVAKKIMNVSKNTDKYGDCFYISMNIGTVELRKKLIKIASFVKQKIEIS